MAEVADEAPDEAAAWALLLALARRASEGRPVVDDVGLRWTEDGSIEEGPRAPFIMARPGTERGWSWPDGAPPKSPRLEQLLDLYMPLCVGAGRDRFTVAHLAQTLDGRIAIASGKSRYISGKESLVHAHRLRALFDAVVVGQRTILADDPQLTTRLCNGPSPVRVVIDPQRQLHPDHHVFQGAPGSTLLLCSAEAASANPSHGRAQVVGIEARSSDEAGRAELPVPAILAELSSRGLRRIFVEGGGITVSRFLAARALERLHFTVAPIVFGSGRPSLTLPEIQELTEARTLRWRHFSLGPDVLFDCTVLT